MKLDQLRFLPDLASELVISVADSHQRSRKSTKTCAVAPDTVKQRLDLALEFVDRCTVYNVMWKRVPLCLSPLAEEILSKRE